MNEFAALMEAIQQGDVEKVRSVIDAHAELVHQRDESGATALHFAALGGNRQMVELLLARGAEINATDHRFGATPAGWAIEYLRERDGYLAIELDDFAFAITRGDAAWVARFLMRFPALRDAADTKGKPFREFAEESDHLEIAALFRIA